MNSNDFAIDESTIIDSNELIKGNLYTVYNHGYDCILEYVVNHGHRRKLGFKYISGPDYYIHDSDDNLIYFLYSVKLFRVFPIKECIIQF